MNEILTLIGFFALIYFLGKLFGDSKTPPPRIVDPNWVDPETRNKWEKRRAEEAEEQKERNYYNNHFFSLDLDCWVKRRPSGTWVKSVPYEDYKDGAPDDFGEVVDPGTYIDRESYLDYKRNPAAFFEVGRWP